MYFREPNRTRVKEAGIIKISHTIQRECIVARRSVGKSNTTKATHRANMASLPPTMPITIPTPERALPTLNTVKNLSALIDICAIQGTMQRSMQSTGNIPLMIFLAKTRTYSIGRIESSSIDVGHAAQKKDLLRKQQ